MSLLTIAWRSIQQRGIASALTMLSMALGVMLVVTVLTIHGVLSRSFESNASLGYNMIVGAKGGKEQLVLNTVFYLSSPVEVISYDYYLEFLKREDRDRLLKDALRTKAHDQLWQTQELLALSDSSGLESLALQTALQGEQKVAASANSLGMNGKFGAQIDLAIPVCLGDYYGRFRVVGTTPQFFDELVYDIENNRKYEFAQGRNFEHRSKEHGYFEAVVGATVAREMNVKLGDQISPAHGDPEGHVHERKFTVVGILKPSGTPQDRAVFVNMEGFYLMEDHAKSVDDPRTEEQKKAEAAKPLTEEEERKIFFDRQRQRQALEREADPDPLPVEQRDISAILLKLNPRQAIFIEGAVNKDKLNNAQAVAPIAVIVAMFEFLVRPVQTMLLLLTFVICIVSGISILVSIYNSMSERKHEIAVMRALGAGRGKVMAIILLEATLLSLGGCIIGWGLGHLACYLASPSIEQHSGFYVGANLWGHPFVHPLEYLSPDLAARNESWNQAFKFPTELLIVPSLVLLAIVVGLWPAMTAYRTDVARSLGK
jgi:putative ABC transport system permease protein